MLNLNKGAKNISKSYVDDGRVCNVNNAPGWAMNRIY